MRTDTRASWLPTVLTRLIVAVAFATAAKLGSRDAPVWCRALEPDVAVVTNKRLRNRMIALSGERDFTAAGPNQRWVGDTTEFVIGEHAWRSLTRGPAAVRRR